MCKKAPKECQTKKLALDGTHGFQTTLTKKGIELSSSKAACREIQKEDIIPQIHPLHLTFLSSQYLTLQSKEKLLYIFL